MGWAHGLNYKRREIGYGVEATCDQPGCNAKIDRGLAYCCGELAGVEGEEGFCGGYFCYSHLLMGKGSQRCPSCFEEAPWDKDEDE